MKDTCDRCGHPHPKCNGHNNTGAPCGAQPITGTDVCRLHGGSARQVRAAGARRIAQAQAAAQASAAVATLGLPLDITPTDALLEEVRWTAGHVQWLRARVQELEGAAVAARGDDAEPDASDRASHPLVWGVTEEREKTGGEDAGHTIVEQAGPSVWYLLYERERKHLVTVCAAALKAGVEERKVRLAESEGALVADVLKRSLQGILDALVAAGMEQRLQVLWPEVVGEVVPRELRALVGTA